jgi:hypothetical protein
VRARNLARVVRSAFQRADIGDCKRKKPRAAGGPHGAKGGLQSDVGGMPAEASRNGCHNL